MTLQISQTADTNGAFTPWIRIWAPNGVSLGSSWGASAAAINDVVAPITGMYRVLVASNNGGFNGAGSYELTLTATVGACSILDTDGDGRPDNIDNCSSVANGFQENNDGNFISLPHPRFAFDDFTRPYSDNIGDACDADDDNDRLADAQETGGAPCAAASGVTDPLKADTDRDRWLDGAECALGFDPASGASHPPYFPAPALDSDHDGLPDAFEGTIGADPTKRDTDGDTISDGVEFMFYSTDPTVLDTDGDGCSDAKEIASVNNDLIVSAADLGTVASSFGLNTSPAYVLDFDINKDGIISAADLGLVATNFGLCS